MTPYWTSPDGRHVIYCGDCLEILPTLPKVDAVITDPPYDAKTHAGAATTCDATKDYGVPFAALCHPEVLSGVLLNASRRWVLAFCALEQIAAYRDGAGAAWIRAGAWDKIAPAPQITGDRPGQAVEGIAIMHPAGRKKWNRGGGAAIWRHLAPHGKERPDHPTPKPVSLMTELISDFTDRNETVLDPFMGSGTTGVACVKLGRKFIGIEISREYCDIAVKRMERELSQPCLPGLEPQNAVQMTMFES